MQSCLGVDTLKKTDGILAANFGEWFHRLVSHPQWIARLHTRSEVMGRLGWASVQSTGGDLPVYVFDIKPIPLCQPICHGRVRLLWEERLAPI